MSEQILKDAIKNNKIGSLYLFLRTGGIPEKDYAEYIERNCLQRI